MSKIQTNIHKTNNFLSIGINMLNIKSAFSGEINVIYVHIIKLACKKQPQRAQHPSGWTAIYGHINLSQEMHEAHLHNDLPPFFFWDIYGFYNVLLFIWTILLSVCFLFFFFFLFVLIFSPRKISKWLTTIRTAITLPSAFGWLLWLTLTLRIRGGAGPRTSGAMAEAHGQNARWKSLKTQKNLTLG